MLISLIYVSKAITPTHTKQASIAFPLATKGRWVVDANGNRVKFAGVCLYVFYLSVLYYLF